MSGQFNVQGAVTPVSTEQVLPVGRRAEEQPGIGGKGRKWLDIWSPESFTSSYLGDLV